MSKKHLDAWITAYASHGKGTEAGKHYLISHKNKFPLKEFKELLEYWADEHTQSVAATNSKSHRSITETHTAGTTSFAQVRNEMSKSEKLFSEDEVSHGPSWLIGRHAKTAKEKNIGKDDYVQQLTSEIRKELAAEMEEKVNKKVQVNLRS